MALPSSLTATGSAPSEPELDMTGTVCETITSLPFGDAQVITGNCNNSSGDVSPMHFTGKERDSESGLDNFGARYDSSSIGRFMSPDPLMASAKVWNPQTWDRYTFALNNPLAFVDPTGMEEVTAEQCAKDKNCITVKVNVIYDQNANQGKGLTVQQKADFEKQQLQNAKNQYGNADIHLDVTYTAGSMTMDNKGNTATFTGLKEGALNVVVTDQVPRAGSAMLGKTALSLIPANSTDKEDLPHEMAHQFMGQTQGWMGWLRLNEPNFSGDILNRLLDASNNVERAWMRTFDAHSGPFSHYPLASAFHGNAADFQRFIQPTTKRQ
jgi:RHS repeat-associated protein